MPTRRRRLLTLNLVLICRAQNRHVLNVCTGFSFIPWKWPFLFWYDNFKKQTLHCTVRPCLNSFHPFLQITMFAIPRGFQYTSKTWWESKSSIKKWQESFTRGTLQYTNQTGLSLLLQLIRLLNTIMQSSKVMGEQSDCQRTHRLWEDRWWLVQRWAVWLKDMKQCQDLKK